jgi:hypothetical protein
VTTPIVLFVGIRIFGEIALRLEQNTPSAQSFRMTAADAVPASPTPTADAAPTAPVASANARPARKPTEAELITDLLVTCRDETRAYQHTLRAVPVGQNRTPRFTPASLVAFVGS